jgi:hypothetical protein
MTTDRLPNRSLIVPPMFSFVEISVKFLKFHSNIYMFLGYASRQDGLEEIRNGAREQ